jgi:hypothetical protein
MKDETGGLKLDADAAFRCYRISRKAVGKQRLAKDGWQKWLAEGGWQRTSSFGETKNKISLHHYRFLQPPVGGILSYADERRVAGWVPRGEFQHAEVSKGTQDWRCQRPED